MPKQQTTITTDPVLIILHKHKNQLLGHSTPHWISCQIPQISPNGYCFGHLYHVYNVKK